MTEVRARPIWLWVVLGCVAWVALLVVAWGVQPVDSTALYTAVSDPTPAEAESIESVLAEPERGGETIFLNRITCPDTPLDVATAGAGDGDPTPEIPVGFAYEPDPCGEAYSSARAAFWVNAIAVVLLAIGAIAVRVKFGPGAARSAAVGEAERVADGGTHPG